MKRTIKAASVFIALIMILCSCAEKPRPVENPQAPETQTQVQTPVQAPQNPEQTGNSQAQTPSLPSYEPHEPLRYARYNSLTLIDHSEEDEEYFAKYGTNRYISYVTVSGFKDTTIENSINGTILGIYNKASQWNIPPYRGTGKYAPDAAEGGYGSFDFYSTFNSNDYLCLYGYQTMGGIDEDVLHYTDCNPVTFDLRTGKALSIGDIFSEGYPYEDIINSAVVSYLNENDAQSEKAGGDYYYYPDMEYYVSQVSPFKGIRKDQKFYISDYGLSIILDYNNKELDFNGFYIEPAIVTIDYAAFGDGLLLARECDPSIYAKPGSFGKHPIGNNNDILYESEVLYKGDYSIDYREVIDYSSNAPAELIDIAKAKLKEERVSTEPYERILRLKKDDAGQSYWFESSADIRSAGDYYTLQIYVNIPPVDYDFGTNYVKEETILYDSDLNIVKITDIFAEGFDWQGFLAGKFRESVEAEKEYGYVPEGEVDYMGLAENCKFSLGTDSAWFVPYGSVKMKSTTGGYSFQYAPYYYLMFDSDESLVFNL